MFVLPPVGRASVCVVLPDGARVVCSGACVAGVCAFVCALVCVPWLRVLRVNDTLAEWLRRRPAKPMGSPRVGSNPTGVGLQLEALRFFACTGVDVQKRGCSGN